MAVPVISNRGSNLGYDAFRLESIQFCNQLGRSTKPATIRHEPIDPYRIAPSGVVEALIGLGAGILDDKPRVGGKDAAPPHRSRGENPDTGFGVLVG